MLQSLFMHAPAPLTLLHVGLLQPETQTDGATPTFPYQIMEYGRGQSCGHSTRKVSVALVEAYDYGIIGEVEEKPTCTFFLRFGIPFSMETLSINIMKRPADQEGKMRR